MPLLKAKCRERVGGHEVRLRGRLRRAAAGARRVGPHRVRLHGVFGRDAAEVLEQDVAVGVGGGQRLDGGADREIHHAVTRGEIGLERRRARRWRQSSGGGGGPPLTGGPTSLPPPQPTSSATSVAPERARNCLMNPSFIVVGRSCPPARRSTREMGTLPIFSTPNAGVAPAIGVPI